MKIYNLNDDIVKTDNNMADDGLSQNPVSSVALVITDIKQAVKNPNRVNIYVNDEYAFSLDIAQVVDLHVKKGAEISEQELTELKNASAYGKLYQRTLEWVLSRPHSTKEARDYLYKKLAQTDYDKEARIEMREKILETLIQKGYLDDERFAKYFVENRFVKKGISKKRLQLELAKKGVDKEIAEQVLDIRNDDEEIKKIIAKKSNRYDQDKMINYLVRQGFPFETVRNLVSDFYGTDSQSLE